MARAGRVARAGRSHSGSLWALLLLCCNGAQPAPAKSPTLPNARADATERAPADASAAPGASSHEADTGAPPEAWLVDAHPDLRRLTVVIRVSPPAELVAAYRRLGERHGELKQFFEAEAKGGFGSGFVVVARGASARTYVVTNRHVVSLSSHVRVSFDGVQQELPGAVVYVDPSYDLAVVALERGAAGPGALTAGFGFESAPAKDQQTVVAAGYPGIGAEPSYQVTRGYVSNERFEIHEGGRSQLYIQHTAPIDPGSSGGPLTTAEGRVLGVNTLKVRHRENVGLAIPASVILASLERASLASDSDANAPSADAQAACTALLASLVAADTDFDAAGRALAASFVADVGGASLPLLPHDEQDWAHAFIEDPVEVFLHAITLRLASELRASPGKTPASAPTCSPRSQPVAPGSASFDVTTRRGPEPWTFVWEQRAWKLAHASLSPVTRAASLLGSDGSREAAQKKWRPSLR